MKVAINKLENIGNEKGAVFSITTEAKEIPVFFRKKGTLFGNHYHTGSDKSNNPELIYFLQGKVKFFAKDLDTNEKMEKEAEAPFELVIHPNITHAYIALEDVIFIEPRPTKYDKEKPDTHEERMINDKGEWIE